MKPKELAAGATAGVAAAVAYVAAMQADLAIAKNNTDDLVLLGRPFAHEARPARRFGAEVHLVNGAALGAVYALTVHDRLPGPAWLRGTIFANVENAALYPLAALEDHHPSIREGQLARYWTPIAFLQSIPRHVAFGVVLGALYERLRR